MPLSSSERWARLTPPQPEKKEKKGAFYFFDFIEIFFEKRAALNETALIQRMWIFFDFLKIYVECFLVDINNEISRIVSWALSESGILL